MTPSEVAAPLAAHLHHESRRRGHPLTRAQLEREIELVGTGCDLSDYLNGRVPPGGNRELRIVEALSAEIEAGARALEVELASVIAREAGPRITRTLARGVARHLYGLDGKGETS